MMARRPDATQFPMRSVSGATGAAGPPACEQTSAAAPAPTAPAAGAGTPLPAAACASAAAAAAEHLAAARPKSPGPAAGTNRKSPAHARVFPPPHKGAEEGSTTSSSAVCKPTCPAM